MVLNICKPFVFNLLGPVRIFAIGRNDAVAQRIRMRVEIGRRSSLRGVGSEAPPGRPFGSSRRGGALRLCRVAAEPFWSGLIPTGPAWPWRCVLFFAGRSRLASGMPRPPSVLDNAPNFVAQFSG